MTTQQTELELFREMFPQCEDSEGNMKSAYKPAFNTFKKARAPLLSTIAQQGEALEAARLEREEFDNVRKIVLRLPQYSFLSPQGGGVRRFRDQSGAWIERHEVVQAFHRHGFDTAMPDAALISQKVEG